MPQRGDDEEQREQVNVGKREKPRRQTGGEPKRSEVEEKCKVMTHVRFSHAEELEKGVPGTRGERLKGGPPSSAGIDWGALDDWKPSKATQRQRRYRRRCQLAGIREVKVFLSVDARADLEALRRLTNLPTADLIAEGVAMLLGRAKATLEGIGAER